MAGTGGGRGGEAAPGPGPGGVLEVPSNGGVVGIPPGRLPGVTSSGERAGQPRVSVPPLRLPRVPGTPRTVAPHHYTAPSPVLPGTGPEQEGRR